MVAEAVGGWRAHSLALLADAGHMLSDVAALALSLFAAWIAQRPATPARSYGYHRTEILAALANASTLIAISVWICVEAYHRLGAPPVVAAGDDQGDAAGPGQPGRARLAIAPSRKGVGAAINKTSRARAGRRTTSP